MKKVDIGLIGLAVMGENLVLNMERNGFSVAVYNRSLEKVHKFVEGQAKGKNIVGTQSLKELVDVLAKPRRVMLMVKAGNPVDALIKQLLELLEPGDIIIDGGNSHFADTNRRMELVESHGLLYVGAGVSGGEEGALNGPSIMPGGSEAAWPYVSPIFQKIAAKVKDGVPCCHWVGAQGAGHFVKMVHNGIEYADMQLIGEAYYLMKKVLNLGAKDLYNVFDTWNQGELDSYLIEITRNIFGKYDSETERPMVDLISDQAGQKGTGKWTSQTSLDLGTAAPTIAEAVFARCISAAKDQRVEAAGLFADSKNAFQGNPKEFIESIRKALFASKICAYAQGFALMKDASEHFGWDLDLGEISLLWRGGCIIRAQFLETIYDAYGSDKDLSNLLFAPYFKNGVIQGLDSWRDVVIEAVKLGIPVPAFSSALAYFDSIRQETLWTNLTQAQRDYFGAHTYQRVDKDGHFHTNWMADGSLVSSENV